MHAFLRPFTAWAVVGTLMSSFMGQALAVEDPWAPPLLISTNLNQTYHADEEMRFSVSWKNQGSQDIKVTFPDNCFLQLALVTTDNEETVAQRDEVCIQAIEERSIRSNGDLVLDQTWKLGDEAITPGEYFLKIQSKATLTNPVTGQIAGVEPFKALVRLYDNTVVFELDTTRGEYDRNDVIRASFQSHNYKLSGSATFPNSSCKEANWEISKVNTGEVVYHNDCGSLGTTTITPEQTYVETWSYNPDENEPLDVGKYRLRYSSVAEVTFDIVAHGTSANDDENADDDETVANPPPPDNWPFTDVPSTHWASGYIQGLKNLGLLSGDFLRQFHPNMGIQRAVYLKLVFDGLGFDMPRRSDLESNGYKDVNQEDWYYSYVEFCVQNDICRERPGNSFGVYNFIPRNEAIWILVKAIEFKKGDLPKAVQLPLNDVDGTDWFHDVVSKAYAADLINGYGNMRFGPNNNLTKAEASKIVFRARAL